MNRLSSLLTWCRELLPTQALGVIPNATRKRFAILFGMGIIVILTATVWATIPKLLNFQGVLRNGSGAPLSNSTVSVEFKIYDAALNGNAKWMETQSVTTDTFGFFNVVLGSLTPIEDSVFKEMDRYLGVKVGTDPELLPRVRLVSVAYANRVSTVDGASGGTISGNTVIQSDLTVSGNVGIGTLNPTAPLHISTTGNYLGNFSTTGTGDLIFNAVPGNSGRLVFNSNNLNSPIAFDIGNTELMRVATNGDVGIGTTSPINMVHIRPQPGRGIAGLTVQHKGTGSDVGAISVMHASPAGFGWRALARNEDGGFQLDVANDGVWTPALIVESGAGHVGLGTATPNEQLEITGNLRLPVSTASVGVIKSGADRFIHNFGTDNFFAGINAGNFTLSGFGSNTGVGSYALQALTTGESNTAVGIAALRYSTSGNFNTAVGRNALLGNTSGAYNTAVGLDALFSNNIGESNTAVGLSSLASNTVGDSNTAVGQGALQNTTGGSDNTAVGQGALSANTTGTNNTALGYHANVSAGALTNATAIGANAIVGASNAVVLGGTGAYAVNVGIGTTNPNEQLEITGNLRLPVSTASAGVIKAGANRFIHNFGTNNFFAGVNAGNFTTSGVGSNTGVGANALQALTTGLTNTAVGVFALLNNSTGGGNTAVGYNALYINSTGGGNTAIGTGANVSAGGLTNATAIGYNAIVDASNKVRIGNTSVTSIGGQVGWSVFSDGRLKTNVKKSPLGLDFILQLNPIAYNSLSPGQEGIPYTGLIAQDVEKVLQELGADFSGLDKPKSKDGYYQLRYAEFVMPLIKAMQELNAKNEKLEARLAELEALKEKIKVLEGAGEASR